LRETKLRVVGNFRPSYDGREEELLQLSQNLPLVLPSTHPLPPVYASRRLAGSQRGNAAVPFIPFASAYVWLSPRNLVNFVSFVPSFAIPVEFRDVGKMPFVLIRTVIQGKARDSIE